jgi:hypothetical protein
LLVPADIADTVPSTGQSSSVRLRAARRASVLVVGALPGRELPAVTRKILT